MNFFRRVASRLACVLKNFGVPPRLLGYRYQSAESPREYLDRISPVGVSHLASFKVVASSRVERPPLPANVPTRDLLSRDRQSWRTSLHEIPERPVSETYFATLVDCTVVTHYDAMDDGWFAILGRDGRLLNVRGTTLVDEHPQLLKQANNPPVIDRAAWILECWYTNYFHWLNYHLPKVALLKAFGWQDQILMPARSKLYPVFDESLTCLGVNVSGLRRIVDPVIRVKQLAVVSVDTYPRQLLREVRDSICGPTSGSPSRRIYISRERAGWRRATNEQDVVKLARRFGFEQIVMDDLSFRRQVELMKETRILLSLHGAGLANMLFAPEGAAIIEIVDSQFPEPDYYGLASSLGHRYWMLRGTPADTLDRPGYRDLTVDTDELAAVLEVIDRRI